MQSYKDISNSFLTSRYLPEFPYHNHWQNNPLDPLSFIDSRYSGYKPYRRFLVLENKIPFGNSCSVYQNSCDIVLPINSCYAKNRQIVSQP
jgi:hypothetical protein